MKVNPATQVWPLKQFDYFFINEGILELSEGTPGDVCQSSFVVVEKAQIWTLRGGPWQEGTKEKNFLLNLRKFDQHIVV